MKAEQINQHIEVIVRALRIRVMCNDVYRFSRVYNLWTASSEWTVFLESRFLQKKSFTFFFLHHAGISSINGWVGQDMGGSGSTYELFQSLGHTIAVHCRLHGPKRHPISIRFQPPPLLRWVGSARRKPEDGSDSRRKKARGTRRLWGLASAFMDFPWAQSRTDVRIGA